MVVLLGGMRMQKEVLLGRSEGGDPCKLAPVGKAGLTMKWCLCAAPSRVVHVPGGDGWKVKCFPRRVNLG